MTFKPGNHNTHDVSEAGRKGKAASPWGKARMLHTRNAKRCQREWEQQQETDRAKR